MNKYVSRNDIILIMSIMIVSVLGMVAVSLSHRTGDRVFVYVDGVLTGEYPLSEDALIDISGYDDGVNTLRILDGEAYMEEASCPDKLCIHQGKAYKAGQSIVCLPNRVVIKITGKDDSEYDAITR